VNDPSNNNLRDLVAKAAAGIATPQELDLLASLDAQESERDALALEREAHATIDASLARLFAEPPATLPLTPITPLTPVSPPQQNLSLRWLALIGGGLAAGIAAIVAISIFTQGPGSPSANPDFRPRLAAEFIWDTSVSMGFRPEWRCENDEEFAIAVRDRLGAAMVIPIATTGIELVGWGYSDRYGGVILSDDTMVLLARVEGEEVILLVDRAGNELTTNARGSSLKLNVFEQTLGPLMLVEVTPRSAPGLIPNAKLLSAEDTAKLPATSPRTTPTTPVTPPTDPTQPTNPG
jgi:hypothetical protein